MPHISSWEYPRYSIISRHLIYLKLKQLLLNLFMMFLLGEVAYAQAPNISYQATATAVPIGSPFTVSPINAGGTVPATIYGTVTTIAGSGVGGYQNRPNPLNAQFNFPEYLTKDAAGNLYVSDYNNNAIRLIAPGGAVSTFAGSPTGTPGFADGVGTAALFGNTAGITIDPLGENLFVSDNGNNAIRKINIATRQVTTLVTGITGVYGLCLDATGNVIVAVEDSAKVMKISPAGVVTAVAGSFYGYINSADPTLAAFSQPEDVKVDAAGNIFVADWLNNAVRKISTSGAVTTFAGSDVYGNPGGFADGVGTAAQFYDETGLAFGNGNVLYVADKDNNEIRSILPDGTVSTVAGIPTLPNGGSADGVGSAATFFHPIGLFVDNTGIGYIADCRNNKIRKIVLTGYTIDKPLPAGLSFDSSTGIISGTVAAVFPTTTYTITAFNGQGYSATTITLSSLNNWTGNSTDWNSTSNWSLGHVPATGETAGIGVAPYSGSSQPILNSSTSIGAVIFGTNNSPVLTINSGQVLTVTNGIQVNTGSTATIKGPGNIVLTGASVVNATASLTAASNLVITLGASSTLTNNGTCTLASDANGSASIAAIPSTSSIIGNISVQRYLSAVRGYRLLSSAVYNAAANGNNIYTINYLLNSTFLTGTGNGFSKTGNPTAYLYREDVTPAYTSFLNSSFRGIADISTPPNYQINLDGGPYNIPVANGYLFYFRGGFDTPTPYVAGSAATAATVTATGTLNQGNIVFKDWFTPGASNMSYTPASPVGTIGFNLIGNPYPSSIDWDQFSNTANTSSIYGPNLANYIEVLNPNGSYGVYYAGQGAGSGTNGATNIIPSGQGFFVVALNNAASLTFNENAKSGAQVTGANLLMSTTAQAKVNNQYLRLQMSLDTLHKEDIVIRFNDNAKTAFDNTADALYIKGFASVSLSSLSSDRIPLAINQQPLPKQNAVKVGLNISATASGAYQIGLKDLTGIPQLYDIWLMDAHKKDSVNLRSNGTYNFNIDNGDTTSFGTNRLSLVIRQNPAFAYKLLDFTANKAPGSSHQVDVFWKTQYEGNYTNFTVERSTDNGATYQILGGVGASDQGTYSFIDKSPVTGTNLYRLKQEDINNTITYSKIITIQYSNLSNSIVSHNLSVYPNPVGSTINLEVVAQNIDATAYNIKFMNSTGLIVKEVISSQSTWQGNISNLQPGTYIIRVIDNKTQNIVGENKFVKL